MNTDSKMNLQFPENTTLLLKDETRQIIDGSASFYDFPSVSIRVHPW